MNRAEYDDGVDGWDLIRWRGAVASAIRGRRGQSFLRDLRHALDSMDPKELIEGQLHSDEGVCALGLVAHRRGIDGIDGIDGNNERIAKELGIAEALVREVENVNDENFGVFVKFNRERHTDIATWERIKRERRWRVVRGWVERQIDAD